MTKRTFNSPDETRTFPKGKVELVTVGFVKFGRATFDPGWKWSVHIQPTAKTKSCEASHTQYHVSGRLHVRMDDGTEVEYGPGDLGHIPPGHDAWVVGNKPVVVIDVTGMADYAKKS
jgi:quercetin dioxygenase-like cupin family protein